MRDKKRQISALTSMAEIRGGLHEIVPPGAEFILLGPIIWLKMLCCQTISGER